MDTIKAALEALQVLMASPNLEDEPDFRTYEPFQMYDKKPAEFAQIARNQAIQYAGAPGTVVEQPYDPCVYFGATAADCYSHRRRYHGWNKALVERFMSQGFDQDRVIDALKWVNLDKNGGQDYEPEEAYLSDIYARLMGESNS